MQGRRESLASWIHEKLERGEDGSEPRCKLVSLVHCHAGGGTLELRSIGIGSKPIDPSDLAQTFHRISETHAQGLPGPQQYQVLALFERSEQPEAYPMRKAGERADMTDGLGTESPTSVGILAQHMRHTEAVIRLGFTQNETLFDRLLQMNTMLAGMNEKLLVQNAEVMEVAKDIAMERATEDREHELAMMKAQKFQALKEQLLHLAPTVVNRLAGREVFPQSTADSGLIQSFADSLTADQVAALSQVLTPEQWGPIVERLQLAQAQKQSKQAAE